MSNTPAYVDYNVVPGYIPPEKHTQNPYCPKCPAFCQQRRLVSINKSELLCSLCLQKFKRAQFKNELQAKRDKLIQQFEQETADTALSNQKRSEFRGKIKRLTVDELDDLWQIHSMRQLK